MPIINVSVSPQPSPTKMQAIAKGLTELTARVLHKNPAITAVAIRPVAPDHWFVGEASLAVQGKASFWLDIAVVDGTNTKDEKARYLAEVFAFMGRLLEAPLHEESYALVREVAADAYGYGGITQEHRYISGKLAVGQPRAA
jgi:4-oxalocrotonate tautomerase